MRRKVITQIGSLPYEDISEAVKYSLKHDIPFLPELPKRGEAMLDYIKNPGKLSCLDEFKNAIRGYETVKIQCVGPATLRLNRYSKEEAIGRAYEHISGMLDGINAKEIVLFLDEPALGQVLFDYKQDWNELFETLAVEPGLDNLVLGVHTCGNIDWDQLFDSNIEIISFDASKYNIIETSTKYRNGKRIAWGVNSKKDVKDFQEGDLLTLPCGIGTSAYKVENCDKYLRMLRRVSREIITQPRISL